MINRLVVFSGFICLGVAALMPSTDAEDTASYVQGSEESAKPAQSSWYAGTHTLDRSGDGHFYANTEINGSSMRLLVDTGASVVALTGNDALDAGLSWDTNDVSPIGSGASGTVYGVPAMIERIELGGMVQRNVRAVIIPEGLEISLLGQSFLSNISSVEIEDGKMALRDD